MDWNDFIKPFRQSKIFSDAAWKILSSLFKVAGCVNVPSEEAARSWLYSKRSCKVNTYFPNDKADNKQLFDYFRKRPDGKLQELQQIFRNQTSLDSDSPIDTETDDLDVFCWSLVNQFLDLLGFQRVDIPENSILLNDEAVIVNQSCEKCCLYCVNWKGDKSTVGKYRMPTYGTCSRKLRRGTYLRRRLSSSAVCEDYQPDQFLISNMKQIGYNVENLV